MCEVTDMGMLLKTVDFCSGRVKVLNGEVAVPFCDLKALHS